MKVYHLPRLRCALLGLLPLRVDTKTPTFRPHIHSSGRYTGVSSLPRVSFPACPKS